MLSLCLTRRYSCKDDQEDQRSLAVFKCVKIKSSLSSDTQRGQERKLKFTMIIVALHVIKSPIRYE